MAEYPKKGVRKELDHDDQQKVQRPKPKREQPSGPGRDSWDPDGEFDGGQWKEPNFRGRDKDNWV